MIWWYRSDFYFLLSTSSFPLVDDVDGLRLRSIKNCSKHFHHHHLNIGKQERKKSSINWFNWSYIDYICVYMYIYKNQSNFKNQTFIHTIHNTKDLNFYSCSFPLFNTFFFAFFYFLLFWYLIDLLLFLLLFIIKVSIYILYVFSF